MGTMTILATALIGVGIGFIAKTLLHDAFKKEDEAHLINAYSQGWRECEAYIRKRGLYR